MSQKISDAGLSLSVSTAGYYVGVSKEFEVSDSYSIQPELQYSSFSVEDETISLFLMSIMAKFDVSDSMNLQVGPQFDLLTGDTDGTNVFGVSVAAGAEYQISDRFAIVARYSLGLNNRLDLDGADGEIKMNFFQVGLAFSL